MDILKIHSAPITKHGEMGNNKNTWLSLYQGVYMNVNDIIRTTNWRQWEPGILFFIYNSGPQK